MRNFIFLIAVVLVSACTQNENQPDPAFSPEPSFLTLATYETNVPSKATGEAMPFQETYLLGNNNSFTKTRLQNGITKVAKGKFSFVTIDDKEYIELKYEGCDHEIVTNCSGSNTEHLTVTPSGAVNYAGACDGATLTYLLKE